MSGEGLEDLSIQPHQGSVELWGGAHSRSDALGEQPAFARVPVTESDQTTPNAKQTIFPDLRLYGSNADGKRAYSFLWFRDNPLSAREL